MIEVQDIFKVYENGTPALKKVSFVLPSCGLVALVGTSGSGKSTLLNILSNNDTVSKGQVLYKGKPYEEYKKAELTKDFAYIYQDFKLIENMTVFQNIAIGYELANENLQYDFVLQIAKKLGLENLLDQKVYALSGGQQQRVAIARALARKPKVIFADEPTGNLDTANSEKVYNILKNVSQEILIVIVTHDETIENYADNIIKLDNGRVVLQKQCEKIEQGELVQKENCEKQKDNDLQKKEILEKYKSKTRKKSGLSTKSTLALTLAFNNKGIAKKVVLVFVLIVMVTLIFATLAVLFSSSESSFCNIIKEKNIPYIKYSIYAKEHKLLKNKDIDKLNEYINDKYGEEVYQTGLSYLNSFCYPANNADLFKYPLSWRDNLNIMFNNAIFCDNPSDLGLNIIKGVVPKTNSEGIVEIAISKTGYNKIKNLKLFKNDKNEVIDFGKEEWLGKYIKELNLKITGVFDDYNDYEPSEIDYNLLEKYNPLINYIIMPESIGTKTKTTFAMNGYANGYYLYAQRINEFSIFNPLNDTFKNYNWQKEIAKTPNDFLKKNEIIVPESFANKYFEKTGEKLQSGNTLKLQYVITNGISWWDKEIEEVIKDLTFVVKDISSDINDFVLNEEFYNELVEPYIFYNRDFVVSSSVVTPKFIKDVRNIANNITPAVAELTKKSIKENLSENDSFHIEFDAIKNNHSDYYMQPLIYKAQLWIALPLFIFAFIVFAILLGVLSSDMIKQKGTDILILKTMGAKQMDIVKIFSIWMIFLMLINLIFGALLGVAVVQGINWLCMIGCDYEFYQQTFFISQTSIALMCVITIGIIGFATIFNLQKLSDKNLRKAFQKTKE